MSLRHSAIPFAFLLLIALSAPAQNSGGGTGGGMPMPMPAGGITGSVTTVSGNLITLLNGVVTVDATGATFHNRKGDATIADVKPGQQIVVTVKNSDAAPGTMLQASNVIILDSPAGSLTGPVQSVDVAGSSLTIFGVRVLVTPDTRIWSYRSDGDGKLADIKAGDTVSVQVNITGSALVAESIQVIPPIPNTALEGTVKSIAATSWVITTRSGDVTVAVNAQTKIDPAIKTGDSVHVIGTTDSAGNITAIAIYASRPMPMPASVEGTVKSMGAASWVITTREGKDVTVAVNSDTKIDPAIKPGDEVVVLGTADAAGNITAVAIFPKRAAPAPPPNITLIDGTVKTIGTTSWVITTHDGDVTVIVNTTTKIDPAIKAGDAVTLLCTKDSSGNLVAVAIMKATARRHSAQK